MSKKKKGLLLCLAILPFVLKIFFFLDDYLSVFIGAVMFLAITVINAVLIGDTSEFAAHNFKISAGWIVCELTSWYLYSFVFETELQKINNWTDLGMVLICAAVIVAVTVTVIAAVIKTIVTGKINSKRFDK